MFNLTSILKKSTKSSNYLRLLNYGLSRKIPFNKPHGFKILEVGEDQVTTFLPFKKSNLNHIGGLHACALATLSELTTGLSLFRQLNASSYRIIMKSIRMEYYYQAKTGVTATFKISKQEIQEKILSKLESEESVTMICDISCYDTSKNHICSGFIEWQVKDWKKVKTKV